MIGGYFFDVFALEHGTGIQHGIAKSNAADSHWKYQVYRKLRKALQTKKINKTEKKCFFHAEPKNRTMLYSLPPVCCALQTDIQNRSKDEAMVCASRLAVI